MEPEDHEVATIFEEYVIPDALPAEVNILGHPGIYLG